MGLSKHQEDACESIDASVFSSDMLYDDESRKSLTDYIGRWTRAIAEHLTSLHENGLQVVLPVPRIEVYEYKGYNGGFASKREPMYRCDIICISGEREFGGGWEDSGRGNTQKKYAEETAAAWAARTGWPVFDLGRQPEHDDEPND